MHLYLTLRNGCFIRVSHRDGEQAIFFACDLARDQLTKIRTRSGRVACRVRILDPPDNPAYRFYPGDLYLRIQVGTKAWTVIRSDAKHVIVPILHTSDDDPGRLITERELQ